MPRSKLLLLGNDRDPVGLSILPLWLRLTHEVTVICGPLKAPQPKYDWIISYRYHYKVPEQFLIDNAINFHPAPPWHRGVGGPDWAIKYGWESFGVTAHYMTAEIDAGPIIRWDGFRIWKGETAESLNARAHAHLLMLAHRVLAVINRGEAPDIDFGAEWQGPLHTRKQLDALTGTLAP